jgi:hypothetical protein
MKQIVDVSTGKIIVRDLTENEIAEQEEISANTESANAEVESSNAAKLLLRESATAKLSALGLTSEEISAIIG